MGQRSGVGLVERAILDALDARRAWPGRRAVPCLKILAALEDELGLARGYAYQVLTDLALPWKIPVPLVEGQGNFGGRGNDPPASPPPMSARGTLDIGRRISRGTPAARSSSWTTSRRTSSTDDTLVSIADRAREHVWHARHPELAAQSGLPIKDTQNLASRGDYWFACLPANGTPPEVLRDQLLKVHGVTTYVSVGLPRPLPAMIRIWTRTHQHDLHASLTALENVLASRQQKRLTVCD